MDLDPVQSAQLQPEDAVQPQSGEPAQRIPRMGLKHLMLWMFITAAIVGWAMNNVGARGAPGEVDSLQIMMQATVSVIAVGVGGLFTAAITLLVACVRQQQIVMDAPGHWIAVALSLGYVWMALSFLVYWAAANSSMINNSILMSAFALDGLLQAIVYAGAWRQQAASRWRWLFGWAALTELVSFLVYVVAAMPLMIVGPLPLWAIFSFSKEIFSFVVIITCLFEAIRGKRRDWAHTVSIIGLFIVSLTSYVRLFAFFLMMRF